MCFQLTEVYSACKCHFYSHATQRCSAYGKRGHVVEKRTIFVGFACPAHRASDTRCRGSVSSMLYSAPTVTLATNQSTTHDSYGGTSAYQPTYASQAPYNFGLEAPGHASGANPHRRTSGHEAVDRVPSRVKQATLDATLPLRKETSHNQYVSRPPKPGQTRNINDVSKPDITSSSSNLIESNLHDKLTPRRERTDLGSAISCLLEDPELGRLFELSAEYSLDIRISKSEIAECISTYYSQLKKTARTKEQIRIAHNLAGTQLQTATAIFDVYFSSTSDIDAGIFDDSKIDTLESEDLKFTTAELELSREKSIHHQGFFQGNDSLGKFKKVLKKRIIDSTRSTHATKLQVPYKRLPALLRKGIVCIYRSFSKKQLLVSAGKQIEWLCVS
ncbi:hypothetical protein CLIM01_05915 [Colletotrichum limetticola]|uniref:Uncharacterized protein n=1 Tax=Colletotrichum limetticola TaxID=1209924 RepID=A0ABQ9PYW7_9PEZI|nr:hypothetical protein CLIM01_05915 [Colletotrichum limetticola]